MRSTLSGLAAVALLCTPLGPAVADDMSFRLVHPKGCPQPCLGIILGEGVITRATPALFQQFAAGAPDKAPVYLHSNGGSVMASLELGRALRQSGRAVLVPNGAYCESACAFAFLGGTVRAVAGGGRLGVHKFARSDGAGMSREEERWLGQSLRQYAQAMGAAPSFISLSLGVSSAGMHYLGPKELRRHRVVTEGGEARKAAGLPSLKIPLGVQASRSSATVDLGALLPEGSSGKK